MKGEISENPGLLHKGYTSFKKVLAGVGIDRPVFFGVIAKLWGLCAGPITAILMISKFTPAVQGYYYTFANLLALQIFVELGLGTVIIQFASHEWSKLSFNENGFICGDDQALLRLRGLGKLAATWFVIGGGILVLGFSFGGTFFFSAAGSFDPTIQWFAPWISLSVLTGISIMLVPLWSLLEGCNQVARLYTFRFWQGIAVTISVWISMLAGLELWTTAVSSFITIGCSLIFLKRNYWGFISSIFLLISQRQTISWNKDIFPMQWRIAVSWASGYLVFSLFTPVLFYYQGPVIAGQFGLTWNLINLMGSIASSWLSPKVPRFGILIAQNKFDELDDLFWETVKYVTLVGIGAGITIWLGLFILQQSGHRFSVRLLDPLSAGLLMIAQVVVTISLPFSSYMRAHKEEPLMPLSVFTGIFTGLSTFIFGKYYSITAVATGYMVVTILSTGCVLLIWRRYRDAH